MKEDKKLLRLSLQFFGESEGDNGEDDDFTEDFFDDDVPEYYGSDNLEDEEGDADEGQGGEDHAEDQDGSDDGDEGDENTSEDSGEDGEDGTENTDEGAEHDKATSSSTASDGPPKSDVFEENSQLGSPSVSPLEKADDLISELRALGYVGNDLASLTADMKRRREASSKQEAREERAAVNAEGKRHVRSGVPGKSASGDGTGGVSESRVIAFAEMTGSTKDEARRLLSKHARMINN